MTFTSKRYPCLGVEDFTRAIQPEVRVDGMRDRRGVCKR